MGAGINLDMETVEKKEAPLKCPIGNTNLELGMNGTTVTCNKHDCKNLMQFGNKGPGSNIWVSGCHLLKVEYIRKK